MGRVSASNLGKAYRHYPNRWSRLAEWVFPGNKVRHELKWVLRDLNFSLQAGEAVGIVGINGAGKSTLLKMLTGTSVPTCGSIKIHGRVSALLELGMGFHPDFSGRQNVIMAAQLLGYSVEEVGTLLPDIENFAEIGAYFDEPVRVYSSGMQMRLAFSVATALRPDVLIIDEALSVGDLYFQHKSFNRIREYNSLGTTLLLVSHDKQAIQSICSRAILLNNGRIVMDDDPENVMDYYNALLADHQNQLVKQIDTGGGKNSTVSGTGEAVVSQIKLLNSSGTELRTVIVGECITVRICVLIKAPILRLILGFAIKDRFGQIIYGTNTELTNQPVSNATAGETYVFDISFSANIGPGSYSIQTALVGSETHLEQNFEWRDRALVFEVINANKPQFAGSNWLASKIEVTAA